MPSCYLLPATYALLPSPCYLRPATYSLLPTPCFQTASYFLLPTPCYLFPATYSLLTASRDLAPSSLLNMRATFCSGVGCIPGAAIRSQIPQGGERRNLRRGGVKVLKSAE
jgi:hypothetical protein